MPAPLLIFDLDGTLIDTAPDLVDTLNILFERAGLPILSYETARQLIGSGVRGMIAAAIKVDGRVVAPAELDRMFADLIAYYAEHLTDRSRPFPGVVDALDQLTDTAWRFAVCTNKRERLSFHLLEALNLADRFVAICGQDTFGVQKPDPEMLRRTITAAGVSPQRAVMIGDSAIDIRMARATGIPIIAVDFGYSDRPLSEFKPDRIISHYAQLPAVISAIFFAC